MKIHTANGAITPDQLGLTLTHEHLIMAFAGAESDTGAPDRPMADLVQTCVDRIEELKAGGFSSLLDPCPNDLGRDVELYGEVASRTGFNILFATGVYTEQFGAPYWRFKIDYDPDGEKHLAEMYIKELTEGVGPSRLRPAVIKLAIGTNPDNAYEAKLIKAAAIASNETGAPILAHTEGVGGDILHAKLQALGVPAHRIIVGHSCGSPDPAYHRRIVDRGAYIGFDRFGFTMVQSDEVRTENLHSLMQDGYAQHVLISHDCAFCQRGRGVPEGGLLTDAMLFSREIAPKLQGLGVTAKAVDGLLRDNPRRYFCDEAPLREASASAPA